MHPEKGVFCANLLRKLPRIPVPVSCKSVPATLAVLASLSASPALAQRVEDETWIKVGAYFPDVDSEVSIARPGQENFTTLIDLESDLALSDRDVLPQIAGGTRLGGNWRVEGEFYMLKRTGERSLDREIVFDGVTYPVAADVESGFDSKIFRLDFGYSFIRNENIEAGAALGLHVTNFDVFMRGEGRVGNASASTEVRQRDLLAPLPTVGAYFNYQPIDNLGLAARADYLSLSIGDYSGELLNLQAEATYTITGDLRIGAMYRYVDYQVDIEKDRYTGRMAYKFSGPAVFLEMGF